MVVWVKNVIIRDEKFLKVKEYQATVNWAQLSNENRENEKGWGQSRIKI